jgi:glycosyltransferase involved in cell wall biosynthesis
LTPLAFLVPGPLDQLTGGYLFDRRVVSGLREAGRSVTVIELAGSYPDADATSFAACAGALSALPDGTAAVIDGLALPGTADCLAAAASRLRLIGFVHHPLALETGLGPAAKAHFVALEGRLLPLLRGVICPSAETARAVAEYGVPAERIKIVSPGTAKPSGPRPARPTGPLQLLAVATITPRKGHGLLIEALAKLADLDWRLLCIGSLDRDPATTGALRDAVARHGLAQRIVLAGEWVPERLADAYGAADCFVLPSFHEGYGMAFAEALAHGLPIVAASAGAIPDTVPSSAGLLVPPGDAEALVAALRRLLTDEALRRQLAAGATAAGAALPDWREAVRNWGAAFDALSDAGTRR